MTGTSSCRSGSLPTVRAPKATVTSMARERGTSFGIVYAKLIKVALAPTLVKTSLDAPGTDRKVGQVSGRLERRLETLGASAAAVIVVAGTGVLRALAS